MRVVQVRLYFVLVALAVGIVSPVLSVVAAVRISEHNTRQLAAEYQARSCTLYSRILDQYDENPPTTETGKGLREAYLLQYRDRQCTPRRS